MNKDKQNVQLTVQLLRNLHNKKNTPRIQRGVLSIICNTRASSLF